MEFKLKHTERPYLLCGREDIADFKARLKKDAELEKHFALLKEHGDILLDIPLLSEEYANEVYSQHGNFYVTGSQITDLAETLGFLYAVTGEAKYKAKLLSALNHYGAFSAWTGPQNKDRKIPWHSDLSTTRMLYGFSLAFDFLGEISETERKKIAADAYRLGIYPLLRDWVLPETRIHALDSMGHNWWAVCIGLCGIGILSFYEFTENAEELLEKVWHALKEFCDYKGGVLLNKPSNFDDKGMFYESLRYFNYGVGELLHFSYIFNRCTGNKENFADLNKIAEAFVSMAYFTDSGDAPVKFINFGDSFVDENINTAAVPEYYEKTGLRKKIFNNAQLPAYLLLSGAECPGLYTIYNAKQPDYGISDFVFTEKLRKIPGNDRIISAPDRIFPDSGYAFLRNSVLPGGTQLSVRSGFTWNHAHDDGGSFTVFDKGLPLFTDSGSVRYTNPLYVPYFSSAAAHNVVLVNGGGQPRSNNIRGSKFPGSLPDFYKNGWAKYLLSDQTGATCRYTDRNYRNFLWLEDDIIIIIDDLHSYEKADYTLLLHYNGKGAFENGVIKADNGVSRADVHFISPVSPSVSKKPGYTENPANDNEPVPCEYFSLEYGEKTDTALFFGIYLLNSAADEVKIENYVQKDAVSVILTRGDVRYKIAFNLEADGRRMHVNSNNTLFGLDTDCYILALKETALSEEYLMVYGSYLRDKENSYSDSFKKTDSSGNLKRRV